MTHALKHLPAVTRVSEPGLLSILMPVYNESGTVLSAIEAVLEAELPLDKELIVVNDGSTDGTRELLESADLPPQVTLVNHDRNRGKGAAVRTALSCASGEFSAIFDADLEYDPSDLAALLEPLMHGYTNAVLGVRAFDGYTSHSFLYVLGNRSVTLAANVLFNVYIKDLMTCHKVIRTEVFRELPLREPGFAIEAEITARLIQRGERIFELPVSYEARATEEGKKLTTVDGLRVMRTLLRCRLSRNGLRQVGRATRRPATRPYPIRNQTHPPTQGSDVERIARAESTRAAGLR
jgi:glycosyltransferase involved in cell wall biosynthesis